MRLRASRSAIRSIRRSRVLSTRGRLVGRFRALPPVPGCSGTTSTRAGRRCTPRCPRASPTTPNSSACSGTRRRQQLPVLLFAVHALPRCSTSPTASSPSGIRTSPPTIGRRRRPALMPAFKRFVEDHGAALVELLATQKTQTNEVGRCGFFLPALASIARRDGPARAPRRRRQRRTQPPARPLRVPLRDKSRRAERRCTSSVVHPTCCSTSPPAGPCRSPPTCRTIGARARDRSRPDRRHRPDGAPLARGMRLAGPGRPVPSVARTPSRWPRIAADVRRGDAVSRSPPAIDEVGADGHPVVTNSWVLNYLTPPSAVAYVAELDRIGAERDLSWVFAEAPALVPGTADHVGSTRHRRDGADRRPLARRRAHGRDGRHLPPARLLGQLAEAVTARQTRKRHGSSTALVMPIARADQRVGRWRGRRRR